MESSLAGRKEKSHEDYGLRLIRPVN